MTVVNYFELDKIRKRLNMASNYTKDDELLAEFGKQTDAEIDDQLLIYAKQYGRLQQLPATPLQGAMLTQSIRDASSNRVVAMYQYTKGYKESGDTWMDASNRAIKGYIMRLQVDTDVNCVII